MGHFARQLGSLAWILLIVGAGVLVPSSQAQSLNLRIENQPLASALTEFAEQADVDVVFSRSLVDGIVSSCRYRGRDKLRALRCILSNSGLDARSTGTNQYVIVPNTRSRRSLTVSGNVLDGESGIPLPGAHVYLPDQRRGGITNRTGFFSFPDMREGLHRVRITFVGFAVLDTLLEASRNSATLNLSPVSFRTGDVVVESVEPRPGDRARLPGMDTPPIARLERLPASLGGQDLLEALSWLPGIRRSGEVTGGLMVRGAPPDQNLYLIDGAPVYHPWHAFSLISTFQTETFRSVRVYRGAFPAEYGGRLSAVLDAELLDGRGDEPRAQAALNTHSGRFLIEAPLSKNTSFMFGGRRSYLDRLIGRSHPVSDDFGRTDTLRTGYYFYDWTAKIVLRPDNLSRLSLTSYRGRDDLDLRLPFDLSLDLSSWLRPTDLFFEVEEFWRNRVVSARYERLLSARWYTTITASDSRYEAREGAFLKPTLSSSVRSAYRVDIRDLGVRADVDYFRSAFNEFRFGAQVAAREFDSDVEATIEYNPDLSEVLKQTSRSRAVEVSAYAQDRWRPFEGAQVVAGLRAVAFGADRLVRLEPRFSAEWSVHPQLLKVRGSVSRTYQYLHRIRDRHSFLYDIVSSRWIPSSRSTGPARGTEYALSLESRKAPVTVHASTYLRRQRNVLLPRDSFQSKNELAGPGIEVNTLLGQYVAGKARATGLETGIFVERPAYLGSVALTFERSLTKSNEPGEDAFRPARFDVPRSLRVFGEVRNRGWSYGAGATIRSGYPVTVPSARYELGGPLGDEPTTYLYRPDIHNGRLPAYWRVDVNAARSFEWLDASWTVQLQLYNVLNHRNVIDRLFEPNGTAVRVVDRRGLPILPLFEIAINL